MRCDDSGRAAVACHMGKHVLLAGSPGRHFSATICHPAEGSWLLFSIAAFNEKASIRAYR